MGKVSMVTKLNMLMGKDNGLAPGGSLNIAGSKNNNEEVVNETKRDILGPFVVHHKQTGKQVKQFGTYAGAKKHQEKLGNDYNVASSSWWQDKIRPTIKEFDYNSDRNEGNLPRELKEELVIELSRDTLRKYIKKAARDVQGRKWNDKGKQRVHGIDKAADKLSSKIKEEVIAEAYKAGDIVHWKSPLSGHTSSGEVTGVHHNGPKYRVKRHDDGELIQIHHDLIDHSKSIVKEELMNEFDYNFRPGVPVKIKQGNESQHPELKGKKLMLLQQKDDELPTHSVVTHEGKPYRVPRDHLDTNVHEGNEPRTGDIGAKEHLQLNKLAAAIIKKNKKNKNAFLNKRAGTEGIGEMVSEEAVLEMDYSKLKTPKDHIRSLNVTLMAHESAKKAAKQARAAGKHSKAREHEAHAKKYLDDWNDHLEYAAKHGINLHEEVVTETLGKNAKASDYIQGDSKAQRIKRALGAYYGSKKANEEVITEALSKHTLLKQLGADWTHGDHTSDELHYRHKSGAEMKISKKGVNKQYQGSMGMLGKTHTSNVHQMKYIDPKHKNEGWKTYGDVSKYEIPTHAKRLLGIYEEVVNEAVDKTQSLIRKYRKNEDNNFHDENAVLMAKHFGTPEEHKRAKDILKRRSTPGNRPSHAPYDNDHMTKMHGYFVKHLWPHDPTNPANRKK